MSKSTFSLPILHLSNPSRICRSTGTQILQNKGVIRGIANWGQFDLPRPITLDPRMIRFSVIKLGDKLGGKNGSIEEIDGRIPWRITKSKEHE
jgi:small subunit ribosomal protein S6